MRRPFSRLEASVYERFVAGAVVEVVTPVLRSAIGDARRVLDVGCGGGGIAHRLGAIGVDASIAMATRARGLAAAAHALPFRNDSFDAVVSSCSIKHWANPLHGIGECTRVLRPGGVLAVVEMDRDASLRDVNRFARRTRVPRVLRWLYAELDKAVVLPTAPDAAELEAWVGRGASSSTKLDGLPFRIVVHHP